MAEYTDDFLHDWLFWRPIIDGNMYTVDADIDMDDVVRANLWLDLQARINKIENPQPKAD